ncbi:MAG: dihydrolipoyl dehydrogenase family protein [Acidimicrobiales bacterium]
MPRAAQARSVPPRTLSEHDDGHSDRPTSSCDLLVVGGGAAGIAAARAGVRRGRHTMLVQEGRIGGECTFTGCVPSKTLIEAAAAGLSFTEATARVRAAIEAIAAAEDAEALSAEGVEVVIGRGRLLGHRRIGVGTRTIRARRMVIATGSAPLVPQVPGLAESGYLTNETVFDLAELPASIIVLGGGAIGCELAQAFARLGAEVHLVEAAERLLPQEEPEASTTLEEVFSSEGIILHLRSTATRAERPEEGGPVHLTLADGSEVQADALLVAVGRRPTTDGLDAAEGGIDLDDRGYVKTDRYLATSVPGVYAAGDVTGRMAFTHAADEMGRLAVANAFGRLRRRCFDTAAIPWVTFCDPEVARVGMREPEAAGRGGRVAMVTMAEVDRAVAAGRPEGFVKLIAGPRSVLRWVGGGRLLGATIVAPRAGEMIHEVALAMRTGMFTGRLAQTVHAYPSWSTALRQAAAQFFFEADGRRARSAETPSN